ncbi:MAG: TonB-dependent receptor [Gammaproteobacteria bacterium]|nr:TonB-dependent receptor [Gammaproteobacteria bacterium]
MAIKSIATRPLTRTLAAFGLAITATTAAPLLHAQGLEEVIVTATKRAVGLQDVPIAISVMSGQKIQEQGITELEDLALFMPNVHIAEGGAGTQLFIRGVGSGINYGFEQSVGTFIDGVYYGRGRSARAAFLDLERVEVLKGPQSTLFGKNTIAGAINITTAKPSDEFEGYIDASYETELEGYGVTGMVSGPITDTLRGRLVAKIYEDDGYVENTFTGLDGPQDETSVIRGSLEWDATDNLTIAFKAEHGEFDVAGRQDLISEASAAATALYRVEDPNFNAAFGFDKSSADIDSPFTNPQFDDTESDAYVLTLDYQLGEHTLRSITAYTEYEFSNELDSDYGPLQFLSRGRTEEHDQFSQEFLLTSPVGGTVEYLAGLYYQDEELSNERFTHVFFSQVPAVEAAVLGLIAAGGLVLPPGALDGTGHNRFEQDSETWSAFVELTFIVTDTFRIVTGLRYSEDEKDMYKKGLTSRIFELDPDPLLSFLYSDAVLSLGNPHEFTEDTPGLDTNRQEEHTTGNINLQYDVTDEAMVYLNVSNGYKGGGYDEDNSLGNVDTQEYDDEEVDSVELGAKMEVWDGRARINIAAFYSEFDNLQVSTFDGNCCFNVGNAATSEVKGIETDWTIAATDAITLTGALAYLDATYDGFTDAACNVSQVVDGSCAANGGVQDLSGQPLQFAPDWSANLGAQYYTNLTPGINLDMSVDANYSDEVVVANDLDANLIQDSYWKLTARVALSSADGSWQLAVVGKNLTDEDTFSWGNDVPLGPFGFNFTYFKHIDPPRTFEFQARYNF